MLNVPTLINLFGLGSLILIASLATLLILKIEQIKQLRNTIEKLKKSLDEMDEQAKLIIRTDMELNKLQEELDKKITGLYALQRLSQAISTSLDEEQIFNLLTTSHLEDLGFEKTLGFLWKENKFLPCINIGYLKEEVENITSLINLNKDFYRELINHKKTISSLSLQKDTILKNKLENTFAVVSFVISPILPKEGNQGILFVGTTTPDTLITEGDEELITILANQISQALENARLFEQTWRAQQSLEKKVEERTHALTQAMEDLKKISKRKTDFVSSVSHELRTPLTSIKGYASILLTGKLGSLPVEAKERIEKINRHSDELIYFINDLLDISRIESGRITLKQEVVDLKELVNKVVDLLSAQLKDKQLELKIDILEEAKNVFVDPNQIERVFINLIGNAIKFTPSGGKITIQAHKLDEMTQVDVMDTGCGIPEEAQELIFEEFYRVDNPINQELKGSGLGLTLVKGIIEAHKGKIWVKSKLGKGSIFSFTLPLVKVE